MTCNIIHSTLSQKRDKTSHHPFHSLQSQIVTPESYRQENGPQYYSRLKFIVVEHLKEEPLNDYDAKCLSRVPLLSRLEIENFCLILGFGGGGDQVVSVLAFNSDDPSSNPAEAYNFSVKLLLKKRKYSMKRPGWPI